MNAQQPAELRVWEAAEWQVPLQHPNWNPYSAFAGQSEQRLRLLGGKTLDL